MEKVCVVCIEGHDSLKPMPNPEQGPDSSVNSLKDEGGEETSEKHLM